MRICIGFCLMVLLFSSCGVTLESVVDKDLSQSYDNPLFVIPYEEYRTRNFSSKLKTNFEETFALHDQKAEVLLVPVVDKKALRLNDDNDIDTKINNAVNKDQKDLVILFKPVQLQYSNGSLQSASYQLVGIDVQTQKEVWKANFSSSGTFGPSTFAKASAEKIFTQLREDRIIK